jgi:hypothetical protein
VGPSNDHELEIAMEVDRLCLGDKLSEQSITSVIDGMKFILLEPDYYFLKQYIRWRMANPIVK